MYTWALSLRINNNKFIDAPVLVRVVGQVASNDNWNFALFELLHCDLQWIGFVFKFNHDWCTHCNLQGTRS